MLKSSDELFATSTAGGVMPITKVSGKKIGSGKVGNITRQIHKLYWEKYDNQEVKASSNITFEPELPYIAPTEPVNERRNEGMSVKLLSSALKEIAEDQEVQLLKELDEKYMGLECLPLKSFIKETRAHEIREDAKVNSLKLAKLLKEEGGSMAADQYTHSLELLYQYINRVEYIDKLRGDTYGDC